MNTTLVDDRLGTALTIPKAIICAGSGIKFSLWPIGVNLSQFSITLFVVE